jgi:hypothetical protein
MRGVQTFSLSTSEAEQLSGDGPFSVVLGMGGGGDTLLHRRKFLTFSRNFGMMMTDRLSGFPSHTRLQQGMPISVAERMK